MRRAASWRDRRAASSRASTRAATRSQCSASCETCATISDAAGRPAARRMSSPSEPAGSMVRTPAKLARAWYLVPSGIAALNTGTPCARATTLPWKLCTTTAWAPATSRARTAGSTTSATGMTDGPRSPRRPISSPSTGEIGSSITAIPASARAAAAALIGSAAGMSPAEGCTITYGRPPSDWPRASGRVTSNASSMGWIPNAESGTRRMALVGDTACSSASESPSRTET